ncbi:hypothetical protein [Pseudonocardia asaccharolytica]|uniref:hypothetical protein n=1 Tax=Pseudonocardia asaccharolytica TaxID=54010 RepID=UPI0003FC4D3A|nr:hypothetical protein [Pseudonocardia asaccharolytica]
MDEATVERLIAGKLRRSDARVSDVTEAVRRMRADGISVSQIARRLRTGAGAVQRIARDAEETH